MIGNNAYVPLEDMGINNVFNVKNLSLYHKLIERDIIWHAIIIMRSFFFFYISIPNFRIPLTLDHSGVRVEHPRQLAHNLSHRSWAKIFGMMTWIIQPWGHMDFRKRYKIDKLQPPKIVSHFSFLRNEFIPPRESWWGSKHHHTIAMVQKNVESFEFLCESYEP